MEEATVNVEKKGSPRRIISKKTNTWMKKSRSTLQNIFTKMEMCNLDKQNKNNIDEKVLACIAEFENKLEGIFSETNLITQISTMSDEQKEILRKML